jgi:tail-like repeat protein
MVNQINLLTALEERASTVYEILPQIIDKLNEVIDSINLDLVALDPGTDYGPDIDTINTNIDAINTNIDAINVQISDLTTLMDTHTHVIADVEGLSDQLDYYYAQITSFQSSIAALQTGKSDIGHTHIYDDITNKPSTFPPPLMTGSSVGGAQVGNGLAMSGNFLFVKTVSASGTKVDAGNNVVIDRTAVDTWYPAKADIGGLKFWQGTQTAYDAITTKDPNTIYFIS